MLLPDIGQIRGKTMSIRESLDDIVGRLKPILKKRKKSTNILSSKKLKEVKLMLKNSEQYVFKQIHNTIKDQSSLEATLLIQHIISTIHQYLQYLQNVRITMQQPTIGDKMLFFSDENGKMVAVHDNTQSFHAYAYDKKGIITKESGFGVRPNTFYQAKINALPDLGNNGQFKIYKFYVDPKSIEPTIIEFDYS